MSDSMGPINKKKDDREGKPKDKKESGHNRCPFGMTGGWHLQELPMASLTPEDVLCIERKRRKPYKKPEAKSWDDELSKFESVALEKIARMRPTKLLSLLEAAETSGKQGPKSGKTSKDSS